jgi:hypothetical protein
MGLIGLAAAASDNDLREDSREVNADIVPAGLVLVSYQRRHRIVNRAALDPRIVERSARIIYRHLGPKDLDARCDVGVLNDGEPDDLAEVRAKLRVVAFVGEEVPLLAKLFPVAGGERITTRFRGTLLGVTAARREREGDSKEHESAKHGRDAKGRLLFASGFGLGGRQHPLINPHLTITQPPG